MTAEPALETAAPPPAAPAKPAPDSFFGWDQLILLVTPVPFLFAAGAGHILGLDNDAVDRIVGLYFTPLFFLSIGTAFLAPIAAAVGLLWIVSRHLYLRRWKRLGLYAVTLVALPLTMRQIDGDDLRFRLKQHDYEAQIARMQPLAPRTAHCFVFDRIQDNFYLGGANFSPYEKMIVYVSEDLAGEADPKVERFSPESKCRDWQEVRNIRPLVGRYYLADSFHF